MWCSESFCAKMLLLFLLFQGQRPLADMGLRPIPHTNSRMPKLFHHYSTPLSQRKRLCLFVFTLFAVCARNKKGKSNRSSLLPLLSLYASMMFATTPEPTVLPPSLIADRSPFSIAIGVISSISILILSPGMTISTPSGSLMTPVTSVVLK